MSTPGPAGAPRISVVAATHNRAERLDKLLDGLREQTISTDSFEIVIVDDGSRDHTRAILAAAEAGGDLQLRVAHHQVPRGPAQARNTGWRLASAPAVAFTDDDCVPTPRWLESLLAAGAGSPGLIVQGRTVPDPTEEHGLGPFARTMEVIEESPYFETCNIAYPRELLDRLNGFDSEFPAPAGEDADLGYRAMDLGAHRVFVTDAVVHHAVDDIGPAGILRVARRATDEIPAFKKRPEMRAQLKSGVFYKNSHPLIIQALLALTLGIRHRPTLVFALPYALHLRGRVRMHHASQRHVPFIVLFDAVEVIATIRGAIRHRFPVI